MRPLTIIFLLSYLIACTEDAYSPPPRASKFDYYDKKTADTSIFYGYEDLDTAIFYAKKENKNIIVIFSGWACMSDHGREWKTLAAYGNNDFINKTFIICWLAVDDTKKLKDTSEVAIVGERNWNLKTVGNKNSYFQIKLTQTNTLPVLCIMDINKIKIGESISYTPDKKEIQEFINSGLKLH